MVAYQDQPWLKFYEPGVPAHLDYPQDVLHRSLEDSARRYGAEVVLAGANYDEAYAHARRMEGDRSLVFVHPFDDPRVIAGQGTIGLELLEQCPDLDAVVVPVGGGGLVAGIAVAVKAVKPAVQVIGVQAEELPAMQRALVAGAPVTLARHGRRSPAGRDAPRLAAAARLRARARRASRVFSRDPSQRGAVSQFQRH